MLPLDFWWLSPYTISRSRLKKPIMLPSERIKNNRISLTIKCYQLRDVKRF